jgi:hypothetical protein
MGPDRELSGSAVREITRRVHVDKRQLMEILGGGELGAGVCSSEQTRAAAVINSIHDAILASRVKPNQMQCLLGQLMEILSGGKLGAGWRVAPRGRYLSDGAAVVKSLPSPFLASSVKTNHVRCLAR